MVFVLGCLGLGAVVLTRFGTMPYIPTTGVVLAPSQPAPPPPVPAPVEVPEPAEPAPEPVEEKDGDDDSTD
jgi:hypothetical protein